MIADLFKTILPAFIGPILEDEDLFCDIVMFDFESVFELRTIFLLVNSLAWNFTCDELNVNFFLGADDTSSYGWFELSSSYGS